MFRLAHLPWFLLTYQLFVQAAEVPTSCVDGCSKRTLFNIIWGCLSTTIICAWGAIHPNIPPREGPVIRILRRLELMFWTIVAPEILPCWALNQRLAAMTVRDVYNEKVHGKVKIGWREAFWRWLRKDYKQGIWKNLKRLFKPEAASYVWTLRHGHFLIMGGFHLVEPVEENSTGPQQVGPESDNVQSTSTSSPIEGTDTEKGRTPGNKAEVEPGRVTVLTLEMLRELVNDSEFRIRITDEEIGDRSKGDALAKLILILQSSWFICQCIARWAQGLGLTQLELTTLALASLNGITFILWWDKPLAVEAPVRMYMNHTLTNAERATEGRGLSVRSRFFTSTSEDAEHNRPALPEPFRAYEITLLIIMFPVIVAAIAISPLLLFGMAFFFTISDVVWTSTSFPANATHVPTFYVPRHGYSQYWHILLLLIFGTIFGGIHCAGWNLPFPTHTEQKLWHVASVAVTIFPIAGAAGLVVVLVSPFIIVYTPLVISLIFKFILIAIVFPILTLVFRLLGRSHLIDLLDLMEDNLIPIIPNTSGFIDKVTAIRFILHMPWGPGSNDLSAIQNLSVWFMLAYGAARLMLLGLALGLLRHQPPSAFIAVDWTKFYPHIL